MNTSKPTSRNRSNRNLARSAISIAMSLLLALAMPPTSSLTALASQGGEASDNASADTPSTAYSSLSSSLPGDASQDLTAEELDALPDAKQVNLREAALDGTVTRIDSDSGSISVTNPVSSTSPSAISLDSDEITVAADRDHQLDGQQGQAGSDEQSQTSTHELTLVKAPQITADEMLSLHDIAGAFAATSESTASDDGAILSAAASELDQFQTDAPGSGNTTINEFYATWIRDSSSPSSPDDDTLSFVWTDDYQKSIRYKVYLNLSGQRNYEIGDISFTIPKDTIRNVGYPDLSVGDITVGVPATPDAKAKFAYADLGDELLISNVRRLDAATKFYLTVTISDIIPHLVMGNPDLPDYEDYVQPIVSDLSVIGENNTEITRQSNALRAIIDTSERAASASSRSENLTEGLPANFPSALNLPQEIADRPSEYVFLDFYSYGIPTGNQRFTARMRQSMEGCPAETILIGTVDSAGNPYYPEGQADDHLEYDLEDGGIIWNEHDRSCGFAHTWFACPRSALTPGEGPYSFTHRVTFTVTAVDDAKTDTAQATTTKTRTSTKAYNPIPFDKPHGHFGIRKSGGYDYGYALNQLRNGQDVSADYLVTSIAFGYPWTFESDGNSVIDDRDFGHVPYTTRTDDFKSTFDNTGVLTSDEFEISSIRFTSLSTYDYEQATNNTTGYYEDKTGVSYGTISAGSWGYFPAPHEIELDVYAAIDACTGRDGSAPAGSEIMDPPESSWVKVGHVTWNSMRSTSPYVVAEPGSGATASGTSLILPENVTDYRTEVTTKIAAYIYSAKPTLTLKAAASDNQAKVAALFENSDAPRGNLDNTAHINAYDKDNVHIAFMERTGRDTLSGASLFVYPSKRMTYDRKLDNDRSARRVCIHNTLSVCEQSNLSELSDYNDALATGSILAETEGTFYDLLPKYMEADLDSIELRRGDEIVSAVVHKKWRGSDQDMLVVKAKLRPSPYRAGEVAGKVGYADKPTMTYDAYLSWDSIHDLGFLDGKSNVVNNFAFESANATLGTVDGYKGETKNLPGTTSDAPTTYSNNTTRSATTGITGLMTNLNPTRSADETSFAYARRGLNFEVDMSATVGLTKTVSTAPGSWESVIADGRDTTSGRGPNPCNVYEGQGYTYRLRLQNSDTTRQEGIILYDNLEAYVPTGEGENSDPDVDDMTWRGTITGVDVDQIRSLGADPIIYYSTMAGLALDDDETSSDTDLDATRDGQAIWQPFGDGTGVDLAQVRAIAIDCTRSASDPDEGFTLGEGQSLSAYISMVAPSVDAVAAQNGYDGDPNGIYDTAIKAGQSEAGITGGAHAYNNVSMISTELSGEEEGVRDLIHEDYTKVGLVPYTVRLKKEFSDDDNRDGMRPGSVSLHLMARYKSAPDSEAWLVRDIQLDGSNGWFCELRAPRYDLESGKELHYFVTEDPVDGYNATISRSVRSNTLGFVIENAHEVQKVSLRIDKAWIGDTSDISVRPETVEIEILDGDEVVAKKCLSAAEDWQMMLELPRYKEGGQEISYNVRESYVEGYSSSVTLTESDDQSNGAAFDVTKEIQADITNTYHPYGNVTIGKQIENATNSSKDATFTIEPLILRQDGEPDSGTYEWISSVAGRSGSFTNGVKLTIKGGETITIKDIPSEASVNVIEDVARGWTLDEDASTCEATIRADQTSSIALVNDYSSSGTCSISAAKKLTGHALWSHMFKFELLDEDMQTVLYTAANGTVKQGEEAAAVLFPTQTFTQADHGKTTTRYIREVPPDKGGYDKEYSRNIYKIEMTPYDDGNGNMDLTGRVTYTLMKVDQSGSVTDEIMLTNPEPTALFENAYHATGEISLSAWKTLQGAKLTDEAWNFQFALYEKTSFGDAGDMIGSPVGCSGTGAIKFPALEYDESNAGKTYYYIAREIPGTRDDVEYSDQEFTYSVKVVDNGDGTLSFDTDFDADPLFVNSLKPGSLSLTKRVEEGDNVHEKHEFQIRFSNDGLFDGEWKFNRQTAKEPVPEAFAVYYNEDKTLSFYKRDRSEWPGIGDSYDGHSQATMVFDDVESAWGSEIQSVSVPWSGLDATTVEFRDVISPTRPALWFCDFKDLREVKGIENLDLGNASNIEGMFSDCSSMRSIDLRGLDTSNIESVSALFRRCTSLENVEMSGLDFRNLESINELFYDCSSLKIADLSCFANSPLTRMTRTFAGCSSLTTILSLDQLDTSGVLYMIETFYKCSSLTSIDLSSLDLHQVTKMQYTFCYCTKLTSVSLRGANLGQCNFFEGLFAFCSSLVELDMTGIDTHSAIKMTGMFHTCSSIVDLKLGDLDTENVTDMLNMFRACANLKTIDLSGFDTSKVENIAQIFCECRSLTSVDVSNFDTSSATDMTGMFFECSSLVSLNLSNFNTFKVTTMYAMFYGCERLTNVNLSSFNTPNVTDMSCMFLYCRRLASLNLGSFKTSMVTDMSNMFGACTSLTALDLSSFNTSRVTTMSSMFSSCVRLSDLDLSNFTTDRLMDMNGMFWGCESIPLIDLSSFTCDKVTNMLSLFADCTKLATITLSEDLDTSKVKDMTAMFMNCTSLVNIDVSLINTSNVINFSSMFARCEKLSTIDVSNFDTRNVTTMVNMFGMCNSLASLDLTGFVTNKVTDMSSMFMECSELAVLDISSFDTSKVTTMSNMFHGCTKLVTIYASNKWTTSKVSSDTNMFRDCTKLKGAISYSSSKIDSQYANYATGYLTYRDAPVIANAASGTSPLTSLDRETTVDATDASQPDVLSLGQFSISDETKDASTAMYDNDGFPIGAKVFEAEKIPSVISGTLNACNAPGDTLVDDVASTNFEIVSGSIEVSTDVIRSGVVGRIDSDFISINGFSSEGIVSIAAMVAEGDEPSNGYRIPSEMLSSAESAIDAADGWNAIGECQWAITPEGAIEGERVLIIRPTNGASGTITGSVDERNVTFFPWSSYGSIVTIGAIEDGVSINGGAFCLFNEFSALTRLDLSGLDTSNITNMGGMFCNCPLLDELDVSGFDTSNVERMINVFEGDASLSSLDVSGWDTSKVEITRYMFKGCAALTEIDLSSWDMGNNGQMNYMFEDCTGLTSIDLSSWDTHSLRAVGAMFSGCKSLESANLRGFDTSNVIEMTSMFEGCTALSKLNISTFNTKKVTGMAYMFYKCASLTSLDLRNFDAPNVTSMRSMFNGCTSLRAVDLRNCTSNKLVTMAYMFANCTNLLAAGLDSLNTQNVTDMSYMFYGCQNMVGAILDSFNTSQVTTMSYMFYNCKALDMVDLSSFNTSQVTDMSYMFSGCESMLFLDLRSFNTSKVTTMRNMFAGCTYLGHALVDSFDTSNVTIMAKMFEGCASLLSLNLSSFDTSKAATMIYMFNGCENLVTLDLSNFCTTQLTSGTMGYFLQGCAALYSIKIGPKTQLPTSASYFPTTSTTVHVNSASLVTPQKWVSDQGGGPYTSAQLASATASSSISTEGTWYKQIASSQYALLFDPNGSLDNLMGAAIPNKYSIYEPYDSETMWRDDGYDFKEWNTKRDGTGISVPIGSVIDPALVSSARSLILYAIWEPVATSGELDDDNTITLTLHGNETVTFDDIPAGTKYTIWENTTKGWVCVYRVGDTGTIKPLSTSNAVFTNHYDPEKTQAEIRATKTLDGEPSDGFSFSIYEVGAAGDEIEEGMTPIASKVISTKSGAISYTIDYTADDIGQHTYAIRENKDATREKTIAFDDDVEYAVVSVFEDEASGTLAADVTYPNDTIVFENVTRSGSISITKDLFGTETVPDKLLEKMTFEAKVSLTDKDGQELEPRIVELKADGTPSILENIPSGTTYEIEEINIPQGYEFDEYDSWGLSGVVKPNEISHATIANYYRAHGEAAIIVNKELIGGEFEGDDFEFQIAPPSWDSADGRGMDAAYNDLDGQAYFFVSADTDGWGFSETQEYVIWESGFSENSKWAGLDDGLLEMDGAHKTVQIHWSDDGHGTLTPEVIYPDRMPLIGEGEDDAEDGDDSFGCVTFTNRVLQGELVISKAVVGATSATKDKVFSFDCAFEDAFGDAVAPTGDCVVEIGEGEEMPDVEDDIDDMQTPMYLDGKLYLRDGDSATLTLPVGTTYEITERTSAGFIIRSEGSEGTIEQDVTSFCTFTNDYSSQGFWDFLVSKKAKNFDLYDKQFSFIAMPLDESGSVTTGVDAFIATNDESGSVRFPTVMATGEDDGKTLSYLIQEVNTEQESIKYDESAYIARVTLIDNGDGTMSPSVRYEDADGNALSDVPTFINVCTDVHMPLTGSGGLGDLSRWAVVLLILFAAGYVIATTRLGGQGNDYESTFVTDREKARERLRRRKERRAQR